MFQGAVGLCRDGSESQQIFIGKCFNPWEIRQDPKGMTPQSGFKVTQKKLFFFLFQFQNNKESALYQKNVKQAIIAIISYHLTNPDKENEDSAQNKFRWNLP